MANLNINGSVEIAGTLHGTYTGTYCTDMDSISSVYDSGWLELPNSPWLNKDYPRGFGNNYSKFRVINNIVFINISMRSGISIPVWKEGSNIAYPCFGIMPIVLRPSCTYKWLANPIDSSGYEISVALDPITGKITALCLGGSKPKTYMEFCTSYPTDNYEGISRIDQGLKNMYN